MQEGIRDLYVTGQASVNPEALDMARQMALWDGDGLSYLVQPPCSVCSVMVGDTLVLITSGDGELSIFPATHAGLRLRVPNWKAPKCLSVGD